MVIVSREKWLEVTIMVKVKLKLDLSKMKSNHVLYCWFYQFLLFVKRSNAVLNSGYFESLGLEHDQI